MPNQKNKNNLNLGAVVRQGTSNFARPIGKAFLELASLHPLLGIGVAGVNARFANNKTDKYLNTLAAIPIPIIRNLFKTRKIVSPIIRTVSNPEPGITRIALNDLNKELGYIDLSNKANVVYPEFIRVNESGKGLSKALYAAGIETTGKPILSGEVLLQPEKTTRTYKYFNGPELPPLIYDEGYDYPRKIMLSPKNPNLYEDTIKEYQNINPKFSNNFNELWQR